MAKLFADNSWLQFSSEGSDDIIRIITDDDADNLYELSSESDILKFKGKSSDPENNPDIEDKTTGAVGALQFNAGGWLYWDVIEPSCSNMDICKKLDTLINKEADIIKNNDQQTDTLIHTMKNGMTVRVVV